MAIYILKKDDEKIVVIGDNGSGFTVYKFEKPNGVLNPTPIHDKSLDKFLNTGFRMAEGKLTAPEEDKSLCGFFATMSEPQLPKELAPDKIHFMQNSIRNETGPFTVLGNAELLTTNKMGVEALNPMRVWLSNIGKTWTLDHRRLAAFRLAKVDKVPVEWVDGQTVNQEYYKMTTRTGGLSIKLKLGGNKNVIVE